MDGIRLDSPTARRLAETLGDERFCLIDVGCSGGLDPGWRVFGDRLKAFGFDPSIHEIERLTRAETRPDVRYVNGFVGLPDDHPLRGAGAEAWRTDPWRRVSAYRTQSLQQARSAGQPAPPRPAPPVYRPLPPKPPRPPPAAIAPRPSPAADQTDLMSRNLWALANLGGGTIHLPDFLGAAGVDSVDFVKIDVDGTDFEVLRSLDKILDDAGVLGATIEVNFSGTGDEDFNSFHNVDRFMRLHGFDLMDLTVRRYALAALPFPFLYPHPFAAQTTRGRPLIGDVLYLRDFGHGHRLDPAAWSDAKLIKLAALYALFGLLDHAAELLTIFEGRLSPALDLPALLESLTAEIQDIDPDLAAGLPRFATRADYLAAYEADDPYFYGAENRDHDRRMAQIVEHNRLAAEWARLHEAYLASQAALEHAGRALDAALATQESMTRTFSWRLGAPLRALRRVLIGDRAGP